MKDFRFHETLYRDKHGRFVLVGSGGRMSLYGVRCYDEHYIEGEVCRQIKNVELLNWLLLRGLEEKIAECFPNLDQGDFSCPFTT